MLQSLRNLPCLILLAATMVAQSARPVLVGPGNDASRQHYDRATGWARSGNYGSAVEEYRKAYEADTACVRCATAGIQMAVDTRDAKAAIRFADLVLTSRSPSLIRYATYAKGHVLLLEGESSKKKDKLQESDEIFSAWLVQHPEDLDILYDDGIALSRLEKDPEAAARFAAFVKTSPSDGARRLRVMRMTDRPELGRARMAPAFTAKDINGQDVSPDALNGRVVLIDFWATWCGPCNEELPHIKKIAQTYSNQPLTVISVSWDSDVDKWKQFVAKNGMNWTQVRDGNHSITNKFGIDAIPHYFTIDTDGVLQAEQLGGGNEIDGKLKKLVAEAVKHQQQMQQPKTGD